ncbi:hypothetical protein Tco_1116460 [Tanacetum coccineum]
METWDLVDTPMVEKSKLDEDPQGKAVDPTRYRGMIGTLMYLTSSRTDLVFIVYMCARIMNQEEIQQVTARDEKWVPTKERVKIGTTNVRLDPTLPQKEETFQVIIDVIKNLTCLKAFTISTEVPEIFMQQFWHTIKKVKGTNSYKFDLANKKYVVDAEVFRKILNICPRVQGEDFTEVPDDESTLTFLIENSESYQMFIKYSTGLIPPKKSRGKGSQGKKSNVTPQETIDVSEESDPEPVKRRNGNRSTRGVSSTDELLAADTMQAIKESKKINKRQPNSRGSSEGTSSIPGVPDESTIVFSPSSERTGTKPGVLDEEKDIFEAKADTTLDWGSEEESEYFDEENVNEEENDWIYSDDDEDKKDDGDDDKSIDLENTEDEETDDEKSDEEIPNTTKEDAKKTKEVKDDNKKAELPPTSSSLSISSGFTNQFLNLSSDKSTVGNLKDTTDAEINSLLDIKIQSEVPYIQSPSTLTVPVLVIPEPLVL